MDIKSLLPGKPVTKWTGKIALSYSGDNEYKYDFHAQYESLKLEKVLLPAGTEPEASKILKEKFSSPEKYKIIKVSPTPYRPEEYAAVFVGKSIR